MVENKMVCKMKLEFANLYQVISNALQVCFEEQTYFAEQKVSVSVLISCVLITSKAIGRVNSESQII